MEALNARGGVLLPAVRDRLAGAAGLAASRVDEVAARATCRAARPDRRFDEEERSRQPSTFTAVRAVLDLFAGATDEHLGLYGAFGYDLAFQFEPIELVLPRPDDQRDMVLYLPDDLVIVDHRSGRARAPPLRAHRGGASTAALARDGASLPYEPDGGFLPRRDHEPGGYAQGVKAAREAFARGDLFEVVPGQTFVEPCPQPPSELFRRLRAAQPVAVRLPHQSRRRRVARRRVAGDVRAGRGRPGRDVPHLGDHRAGQRPHRRRRRRSAPCSTPRRTSRS